MPWFEYGLMEPADSAVVVAKPDWVMSRADGQRWMAMHGSHRMAWLNPAHPEVRERFIGLVVETLKRCPMHGLQLDDHFAWPVEFGYDPFTECCIGTRRVWKCQGSHQPALDDLAAKKTHHTAAPTANTPETGEAQRQHQPVSRPLSPVLQPLAAGLGVMGDGGID